MVCGDLAEMFRLGRDSRVGAVEFQQQMRRLGQVGPVGGIQNPGGGDIDVFDARRGQPHLHGEDHGVDGPFGRRETANGGGGRLGLTPEFQGQFGDQAQRPFGADEQRGQVIARRRFPGTGASVDDAPVGQHDLQPAHLIAHRAVAHRRCPAGPRCGHTTERGIGAGIDGKHQAGGAEFGVQRLARAARLDAHQHVVGHNFQHRVHVAEVDRNAAARGRGMAFQAVPVPQPMTGR